MREDVEQRLFDSARRRAYRLSFKYFEPPPPRVSSYDSHTRLALTVDFISRLNRRHADYGSMREITFQGVFLLPAVAVLGRHLSTRILADQPFGSREAQKI